MRQKEGQVRVCISREAFALVQQNAENPLEHIEIDGVFLVDLDTEVVDFIHQFEHDTGDEIADFSAALIACISGKTGRA